VVEMVVAGKAGHNQKANPSPSGKNMAPWSAMAWSLLLDDCEEMEMIGDAS